MSPQSLFVAVLNHPRGVTRMSKLHADRVKRQGFAAYNCSGALVYRAPRESVEQVVRSVQLVITDAMPGRAVLPPSPETLYRSMSGTRSRLIEAASDR